MSRAGRRPRGLPDDDDDRSDGDCSDERNQYVAQGFSPAAPVRQGCSPAPRRIDRCDELIPAFRKGTNVARRVGRIAKRRPHLRDGEVQALVEINEGVVAPDRLPQRVARHDFAGVLDQNRQHVRRLRLQLDDLAVAPQLAHRRVERKRAERRLHFARTAGATLGSAAMTSISSMNSGRASLTTCTSVLAGVVSPKYFARTSRTAGALSM